MKASAVKRGRNPAFPYVPVVLRDDGRAHNTNSVKAFATRPEAVAHAQAWIDHATAVWAAQDAARRARRGA
jgi:hypothetical protein